VKFVYDERTRLIEEVSLDAAEEPVDRRDKGWHRRSTSYAPGGAKAAEMCFKVSGAETPCEPAPSSTP